MARGGITKLNLVRAMQSQHAVGLVFKQRVGMGADPVLHQRAFAHRMGSCDRKIHGGGCEPKTLNTT